MKVAVMQYRDMVAYLTWFYAGKKEEGRATQHLFIFYFPLMYIYV